MVLAVVLGGQGGLARAQGVPCTVVERVGVGLDLGTPFIAGFTGAVRKS